MRVTHIITCLLRGGSEENTIATCRLQAERGHEVTLIHGGEVDPAVLGTVPPTVATVRCDRLVRRPSPLKDMLALRDLHRILKRLDPDVVHTHASKAGILGRMAAARAQVPMILHGVHILPFLNVGPAKKLAYWGFEKLVAPATDGYIAVSRGMAEANLAAGLGTAATNHVVYSGMNIERFRTARPLDPRPAGRWLVIVASLEARKRHAAFLRVFAKLVAMHPDLRLALLGTGPEKDALQRQAKALGIHEHVHFLGFRNDAERWMATAEVCVLPSMREGLPRSVIQAVATGRPVVVSQLPGLEEIVTDGENGFITEARNVGAMLDPLDRLLSDRGLQQRMSVCASAMDVSRWSDVQMEGDVERIMRQIEQDKRMRNQIQAAEAFSAADPLDRSAHR